MPASLVQINPEQLCIGLYVHLDLSWWEHDFVFNQFKIQNESQLRALQELNLNALSYEPERSDCAPLPLPEIPEAAPEPVAAPDPQLLARQARAKKISQLRAHLANVEKRFTHTSQRIKDLNQTLRSRPEDAIQESGAIVREMVETLLGAPGVVLHGITGKTAEDSYYHALNVTALSLLLGRQLGLDSEACSLLGLGALLHDIGKLQVPSNVLLKTEPLNRPEQQLFELHTEFGNRLGQKLMLDDEVLRIIAEHHEHCDGSGYPRGLSEAGISRFSRIVAIVNHFDGLCNPRDLSQALTPHEALAKMYSQQRAQFDEVILKTFIRTMGVYPPGSLVQLDDGRYALVLGMNPGQTLKPTLILFDEQIPKQEALIVDLSQEPQLNISKSLRPAEVPLEVLEYLSPRQNLGYHLEPSSKPPQR